MRHLPGFLSVERQYALVAAIRAVLAEAPLYGPVMPRSGSPYSVRMSNCGRLGWLSDQAGYRYTETHPRTGRPWPALPSLVIDLWRQATGVAYDPEACLINYYGPEARLGLHRDEDEQAKEAPILSLSLGDTALFRLGGPTRKSPTRSVRLSSGDAVVLEGPSRDWFHGVDRIVPGTSRLLEEGGRFNLTVRRVSVP
jgi:alkylated DNA repair protein (DNA oxidative demethylase)